AFEESLLAATQAHLRELYQELIAPLRSSLAGRHLVVVPHGPLHYLPFHALHDGQQYLIDSFSISYAPSAALYALCQRRRANTDGPSLVLRVPDSRTPFDLYSLRLPAELITLSGCATGMTVVAAGDELLGLVRGFLGAGARSLLLTLWDVHDRSTATFMKAFYHRLQAGKSKPEALQSAMQEIRQQFPHPFYW